MIPLLPSSGYTRSPAFVAQEWNAIFASNASTPANTVTGGWKGILYANYALVDPVGAFNFFAQPNFDYSWIDGGASRTWYLAYAAGEYFIRKSLLGLPCTCTDIFGQDSAERDFAATDTSLTCVTVALYAAEASSLPLLTLVRVLWIAFRCRYYYF